MVWLGNKQQIIKHLSVTIFDTFLFVNLIEVKVIEKEKIFLICIRSIPTCFYANYNIDFGSGCGSVGGVVASNIRDPRFKSSSQKILITTYCIEKRNLKKKRPV